MAVWQFDFRGLKILGEDGAGWPITEPVSFSMEFRGTHLERMKRDALGLAREQYPDIDILISVGFERIDKRADYGYREVYSRNARDGQPIIELPGELASRLWAVKRAIIGRLFGEGEDWEHARAYVEFVSPSAALLYENEFSFLIGNVLSHDEAAQFIAGIQAFYSRVTPEEIVLLNVNHEAVTHEELLTIRKFATIEDRMVPGRTSPN